MKTLIAEDDFTSRLVLQEILKVYGPTHTVVNGREALEAVDLSLKMNQPYDLICLDIMMPELDGQETLIKIRELEERWKAKRARIIMTTGHADEQNVSKAIQGQCDDFMVKPVLKAKMLHRLRKLNLIT